MDQQPLDVNVALFGADKAVEAGLKSLWERVKRAGELINQLRDERSALLARVGTLESEVLRLRQELQKKEDAIKNGRGAMEAHQNVMFSNGDREALTARVRELLAKLEAYL